MKKVVFLFIFIININVLAKNNLNEYEDVLFSRCVDGDTAKFIINNEEKIVRFLAIDTPESVKPETDVEYLGKEASEYTCNRLKKAQIITLEYDHNSDKVDKYDRTLAFVYVDDELLQADLVSKGYAKVAYVYDKYEHIALLEELEEKAKNERIGIWNNEKILLHEENIWDELLGFLKKILIFISNLFA